MMKQLFKMVGPLAYRGLTVFLPIALASVGAFVLLNYPDLHSSFCGHANG